MKSDANPIQYLKGTSAADRRFCRRIICSVANDAVQYERIVVACSGGIDSTVLVHALGQALRIQPTSQHGTEIAATAVYLNHHLREDEVATEAKHVSALTARYLTFPTTSIHLDIEKGPGLQERARKARYDALIALLASYSVKKATAVWMAHTSSDNAETKLFQFLKGRPVLGIPKRRVFGTIDQFLDRPLLMFSRMDVERYAKCFDLKWCEDSSNAHDDYTRNKIRHHLIPWIEKEINPGFVDMLTKEN